MSARSLVRDSLGMITATALVGRGELAALAIGAISLVTLAWLAVLYLTSTR